MIGLLILIVPRVPDSDTKPQCCAVSDDSARFCGAAQEKEFL
jgi:hypothetical protein